jgi:hypothetical protein
MAQYVVHKIGFYYTDECFMEEDSVKGTVMGITKSLEEALAIKKREDIQSMKRVAGWNAVDFMFDRPNYDEKVSKLEGYYQSEFGLPIENKYRFLLPEQLNDDQAATLLSIIDLSFHNVVEYADDEVIDSRQFKFDEEGEVGGF